MIWIVCAAVAGGFSHAVRTSAEMEHSLPHSVLHLSLPYSVMIFWSPFAVLVLLVYGVKPGGRGLWNVIVCTILYIVVFCGYLYYVNHKNKCDITLTLRLLI